MLPNFSYVRAASMDEAIRHLRDDGARLHAGGSDLLGCLRDEIFPATKLVSIAAVPGLRGIRKDRGGGVVIGALTTIAEVAGHELIAKQYTGLAQAAAAVASPQLRNQGTLGGNLCQKPRCWYYRGEFACLRKGGQNCFALLGQNQYHAIFGANGCCIVHPSDTAPALIALGAEVRIAGPDGERSVPAESFHVLPRVDVQRETVLEPGEIVTEIFLPAPWRGLRSSYRKVRARQSWDFALVGVALALQLDDKRVRDARVVFSGVAPVPWRAPKVEETLTGRRLDKDTIAAAAAAAVAGAEALEHNGYKIPMLRGLLAEQLGALA